MKLFSILVSGKLFEKSCQLLIFKFSGFVNESFPETFGEAVSNLNSKVRLRQYALSPQFKRIQGVMRHYEIKCSEVHQIRSGNGDNPVKRQSQTLQKKSSRAHVLEAHTTGVYSTNKVHHQIREWRQSRKTSILDVAKEKQVNSCAGSTCYGW